MQSWSSRTLRMDGFRTLTRHRRLTGALACGALSCLWQIACPMSDAGRVREIRAGRSIQARIPDQQQAYGVRLQSGHSVRVLVEQHDTGLARRVGAPDGRALRAVDARECGVESATIVAVANGIFTID